MVFYFTCFFFTDDAEPATGLTPTIDIRKVIDNSLIINGDPMTEVGGGWYKYAFSSYNAKEDYVAVMDGGITLLGDNRYNFTATDVEPNLKTLDVTTKNTFALTATKN